MDRAQLHKAASWIILITEITFGLALLHMLIMIVVTPGETAAGQQDRGDYVIHAVQAAGGLILNALPLLLNRKTPFFIPRFLHALFSIFLLMALNLGSVYGLYGDITPWDNIQHAYSSALAVLAGSGILWSSLAHIRSGAEATRRSSWLIAAMGFFTAEAVGVFWEFYEYAVDTLLDLNSQRFLASDGTALVGQAALEDTMNDLLTNSLGAFIAVVFVFYFVRSEYPLLQDLLLRIRHRKQN